MKRKLHRTQSRQRAFELDYLRLETKRLLAGDVTVLVDSDILLIVGDADANEVEVTRTNQGVVITGVDTTVNGESAVTITDSFDHVTTDGDAGDDTFRFNDFFSFEHFSFFGRDGNDQLEMTDVSARYFHLNAGAGNDVLDLNNVQSIQSTYVFLEEGEDTLAANSVAAGRNFKVFGAAGDDTVATNQLSAGRRLVAELGAGDDRVMMAGFLYAGHETDVNLGAGSDLLLIDPEVNGSGATLRQTVVQGREGADTIVTTGSTFLMGDSVFDGQQGSDSIQLAQITDGVQLLGFESQSVNDVQALREEVFATLFDRGVDPTPFGGTGISDVEIETTAEALTFPEGGEPVAIDSGVTLTATGSGQISGATISLSDFDAEQDVITFESTENITGELNDNGEMILTGTDSVEAYQAALQSVLYQNTSGDPVVTERQFTFAIQVDDQTFTASRSLVVEAEDSPTVINFTESRVELGVANLPTNIDDQLTIEDPDTTSLSAIVISIAEGFQTGEDLLSVTDQSGIAGEYDSTTGVLTISNPDSDSELSDLQSVLRSLQYDNSLSENQTLGERTLEFSVNDQVIAELVVELV